MTLAYRWLFPAMWLCWSAYWALASRNVKASARREALGSRLLHVVPLAVAVLLLALPRLPFGGLDARWVRWEPWQFRAGAAAAAAGLLFTVWARVHLGRNWSAVVTVKQEHELVVSGPYRYARHPIYTGLIAAFAGWALALGEWRGVLAVAIVFFALWRKLRLEERWMLEQFGDRYRDYSARVAALLPFAGAARRGHE